MPIVGQLVCANTRDSEVVTVFEKVDQTLGDGTFLRGRFGAFNISDQLLPEIRKSLQVESGL